MGPTNAYRPNPYMVEEGAALHTPVLLQKSPSVFFFPYNF